MQAKQLLCKHIQKCLVNRPNQSGSNSRVKIPYKKHLPLLSVSLSYSFFRHFSKQFSTLKKWYRETTISSCEIFIHWSITVWLFRLIMNRINIQKFQVSPNILVCHIFSLWPIIGKCQIFHFFFRNRPLTLTLARPMG